MRRTNPGPRPDDVVLLSSSLPEPPSSAKKQLNFTQKIVQVALLLKIDSMIAQGSAQPKNDSVGEGY